MRDLKKIVAVIPLIILFFSAFADPSKTELTLLMLIWMVLWWVFEILPLGITALIPMIYLPAAGVLPLKEVAMSYSNPVIYLFLGGFIVARGLEKTKLNERIALQILRVTGKSDVGIIFGFVVATAFLSMWISNTATTVMMVPIALSVMGFLKLNVEESEKQSLKPMSVVLFLSIAYSANIGGIMTPIGTPPSVVFVGFLDELYGQSIDFWKWILVMAPVAISLLAIMVFALGRFYPYSVSISKEFQSFVETKRKGLGVLDGFQKTTLIVFSSVCLLWIFKGVIHQIVGSVFLSDTSIALLGGVLLFLIPTKSKDWQPVLQAEDISYLPWNIVLLFGGGMALAGSLKSVGLIQMVTDQLAVLPFHSPYFLVLALACLTLFLTEIMSNVALCVIALPVIMNLGVTQGLSPIAVGLPAAICASFAFSMPISTPPNAIVFGTNQVRVSQMLRAGLVLNFVGIFVVMSVGWVLMHWVLF